MHLEFKLWSESYKNSWNDYMYLPEVEWPTKVNLQKKSMTIWKILFTDYTFTKQWRDSLSISAYDQLTLSLTPDNSISEVYLPNCNSEHSLAGGLLQSSKSGCMQFHWKLRKATWVHHTCYQVVKVTVVCARIQDSIPDFRSRISL